MTKNEMIQLLRKDVVPALGCTEPVCVALAAATAGQLIEGEIQKITVLVNAGIYKNGMSAGIPNCSEVGLRWAATIGAILKNPEKQLELLEDLTPEKLQKAESLLQEKQVDVSVKEGEKSIYVSCVITTDQGEASCLIQNAHTNVVRTEKNGEAVFEKQLQEGQGGEDPIILDLMGMTISEIRALVDEASEEEIAFLLEGVEMNESLAAYSETQSVGVGIAKVFRDEENRNLLGSALMQKILLKVSSAAESRLDGCPLPTMSSSGAGTKGLVVILPVSETAKAIGASREKTVRALGFAHLVNRYVNAYTGKLSPMCSCVMSSSTAAAVGIAYLLGGTDEQIGHTIRNMSGTVTGMICDGGKVGCALKVSMGSMAALVSAVTAVQGAALRVSDGICAETPEDCIKNMARIGKNGMAETDQEILKIMLGE